MSWVRVPPEEADSSSGSCTEFCCVALYTLKAYVHVHVHTCVHCDCHWLSGWLCPRVDSCVVCAVANILIHSFTTHSNRGCYCMFKCLYALWYANSIVAHGTGGPVGAIQTALAGQMNAAFALHGQA